MPQISRRDASLLSDNTFVGLAELCRSPESWECLIEAAKAGRDLTADELARQDEAGIMAAYRAGMLTRPTAEWWLQNIADERRENASRAE